MERRAEPRWAADIAADCRVPATPLAAKVLNISKTGCRVRGERDGIAAEGATIVLQLASHFAVAGQIVWLRGADFGVKFYRPLSEDHVDALSTVDIVVSMEAGS